MLQRSIKESVAIVGIGLHGGEAVKMRLIPMEEESGILFRQEGKSSIKLSPEAVSNTMLATTLRSQESSISTIEHLLAAIYAYGIDNLLIEVDSSELPILDGSAIGFCMLLEEAGVVEQSLPKEVMAVRKEVVVSDGKKWAKLTPSEEMRFGFTIEFDHPVIRKQGFGFEFSTMGFKEQIARARTFGFLKEVQYLRSQNLALGGSLNNAIVLDDKKVLNNEGLRFDDEFVRHKILDAIGDVATLGRSVLGSYSSYAGSHKLNNMLCRKLLEESGAYEMVRLESAGKEVEHSFAKAFG